MAETPTKKTSYRLFKVASALNIGRDTIVEFLNGKGFEVPNKATTKLSEEEYDLVMNKFEREHRQIEKQRKKVDAYHQRRTRTRKEDEESDAQGSEETSEVRETKGGKVEESPVAVTETPEIEEEVIADEVESVEEAPEETSEETIEATSEEEDVEVVEETPVEAETETVVEEVVEEAEEETPVVEETPAVETEAVVEEETEVPVETEEVVEEEAPEEVVEAEAEEETESVELAEESDDAEEEEEVAPKKKAAGKAPDKPQLKGLSVVGKIDVDKADAGKKKKKKRIRSSKVDIDKEDGRARDGKTTERSGEKRKRRRKGVSVSQEDVQKKIRETFSRMEDRTGSVRQKRSRAKRSEHRERAEIEQLEREEMENILHVAEYATVAELAGLMDVDVAQVISKCIGLGLMVSINQRLEKDTITLVADEFDFTVEFEEEYAEDMLAEEDDPEETLKPRAPIVTIMGHVDHGKTSLLDYIRRANVVAGEAGGITQHIGAYRVALDDGREVAFLDTPGHEAFTAMRARGAQVTDIVVLIVAADDSVMPQTIEAISHAQAAGVPMVVAINKVDKPDANPERIKQQLADRNVLVESWGGKVQSVEISAKQGTNVDKLLEAILLQAEILDLEANPDRNARGTIIEAEVDRGRGVVATVLVQKGTLKIGDSYIAGQHAGRVRAMTDERGQKVEEAGPSTPVQIIGLDGTPASGDVFLVMDTEQEARDIATKRQQLRREQDFKQSRRRFTLDALSKQIAEGQVQDLPLIIKGDVDGSIEAIADSLLRLSTSEVQVSVVMKGVGEITESDVLLAAASGAIILGFHVRPNLNARKLAEAEGVDIRTYRIIYEVVDEIRAALEGLLQPEEKEEITSTVEVREVFKVSRVGSIAGCYVADGKITRNDKVRLLRDGFEVYDGTVSTLKRHKDDVREVDQGFECGVTLENMNDIKVGDVIEAYKIVEIKRTLDDRSATETA